MVTYDLMKQQIERETFTYLEKIKDPNLINDFKRKGIAPQINASIPSLSYRQGIISISFDVNLFPKVEVLSVIDILKKYYQRFLELDPKFSDRYDLTAELKYSLFESTFLKLNKEKNQMKISFNLDKSFFSEGNLEKRTEITFKKYIELSQEEIECVLEVWKKYVVIGMNFNNISDNNVNGVINELRKLGAIIYEESKDFTWDSIAGYQKVKQEVKNTIILPFKHPEIYKGIINLTRTHLSSNIPRAVLFEGPPGTGKTTMARIIANESELPLVYVPIESIMSCWYGVAEKRLSKIFDECSKIERSILFLDEIDSLAGSRDNKMHEATRRILSVLLRSMQGFASVENVLTIGATNRPDDLDGALLSRFNRVINFYLPGLEEREAIFHNYAKHLNEDNLKQLAEITENRSGRDIEDICGDAERSWAREIISNKSEVSPPLVEVYIEATRSKFNDHSN